MPSSSNYQQHKGTTNQPVVQAIVDSLTRCFSPIVGSDEYGTGRCPSTTNTTATANNTRRRDGNSSNKSRRSSTSSTTTTTDQHKSNNNNNNKGTYDADRYIHRKLEIFRTTDEECLAEFGIPHPRPTKRHKSSSSSPNRKKDKEGKEEKGGGSNNHHRNQSANTLVYSSEDQSEEIDNITTVQLREKQRQQAANNSNNPSSTSNNNTSGGNNLANILNILRNPFNCLNELHELQTKNGLCFANPIHENGSFEYDWKLTDEELKKFKEDGMIPDVDESSASLDGGDDEEQTMTSASYFDQKYSHIKITNPPMLLYTEHRVKYEEYDDHIFQIVERRKKGYNVHTTADSSTSNGRRGSPTTSNIVLKKNSKLLESKFKARRDKRIKNGINKGGNNNKRKDDENVVPLAKSSSVSADSVTDPMLAAAVC